MMLPTREAFHGEFDTGGEEAPLLRRTGGLCPEDGNCLQRLCAFVLRCLCGVRPSYRERLIHFSGHTIPKHFTSNAIKNTKYSFFTFLPVVLFQQFRFFFNLFYLLVALAQLVPILQVGPLFTYLAPLAFVLLATLAKEAYDDIKRWVRDKELNGQQYMRLLPTGFVPVSASTIRVGHIIQVEANERVPADLIFLKTTEKNGSCFVRTDQLDGETDWKLRRAVNLTQHLPAAELIATLDAQVLVEAPRQDIYEFTGRFSFFGDSNSSSSSSNNKSGRKEEGGDVATAPVTAASTEAQPDASGTLRQQQQCQPSIRPLSSSAAPSATTAAGIAGAGPADAVVDVSRGSCGTCHVEPLGLDQVLWANTVVASGTVIGIAIYTGRETRASMNASQAVTKVGLFDLEVNLMSKILFGLLCILSLSLVALRGLEGIWLIYFCRFILLLSSIIPISLQVNLIIAKTLHSLNIMRDKKMKGALVRTSTLPEELGRIGYLLSDKTGTLTQNEMHFKKLHIGRALFAEDGLSQLHQIVLHHCCSTVGAPADATVLAIQREDPVASQNAHLRPSVGGPERRNRRTEVEKVAFEAIKALSICHNVTPVYEEGQLRFQAASPDEVALVNFASEVGLRLVERDEHSMTLQGPGGFLFEYEVLHCFPFSSELKRMGIIVREKSSERIFFYVKGAETVMLSLVRPKGSQWLGEECDNFARQGLRTLVFAYKELTVAQLDAFRLKYEEARRHMQQRERRVRREIERLEQDLLLLGLTGVEDKLQDNVPETLEALRHAGIKIWMLTGDKVETATCIAVSAGLKTRHDTLAILSSATIKTPSQAQEALERFSMGPSESVLVVDGRVLSLFLSHFPKYFILSACQAPAVVCCRCSPTQKAAVVSLLKLYTDRRTCAVGDGGNDVSMIQAADVGIGLEGKEGRQASLAADFSLSQFSHLRRLLLWHGRNSYQRSAKLSQFVVHRGLIIAVIQVIFSAVFYFIPLAIFQGWLQVGYATYYTTAPVLSLVLDVQLPEKVVFMFPELYQSLRAGRALSIKSFFSWVWRSVYQGAVVMLGAIVLFEQSLTNIVSITFTSLVLAELLNVASEIQTWHPLMVSSEICTVTIYIFSMFILRSYFDITFVMTHAFWAKVFVITLASWLPPHLFAVVKKIVQPPQYSKLTAA
ncbi:phospholipid-transporting ATPase, P-type, putative [Eimeria necatrix]|uniref:Phospholipid-transporting ATPase n=1 Tax=Eimeria necatrix TaxID=51315 RepID=U6MWS9_9EIME|nr:phospholipid-transporting ATPase, P-type, putative [Eimeria necatrix]CDJ67463.1 phospholipid-transporting ATPase, P-type, putative [Eimeria necatrix]